MRCLVQSICFGAIALSFVSHLSAETVSFELIRGARSADDMSPDGRYVVGVTNGLIPYLYDTVTQTMTILPADSVEASAVSDSGDVVFGEIADPGTGDPVAAIWTRSTGVWTSIGYLPSAAACPSRSSPYELSADGSVAVGLSWVNGCDGRGFRWTQATGMVELEGLANGANRASVCSADGNVIGGFAQGSFSRTPAVWDAAGNGTLLDPPDGDALGEIYGIRDDGSILLGDWDGKASTWTYPGLVRTQLGGGSILPGWSGNPMDIADNNTIVGFDFLGGNRRAWIQFDGGPLVDFKTYVQANGGVVPSGTTLEVCQAVSTDGYKIIGHGFASGAWLVTITPETCAADLAPAEGDDNVNVFDLFILLDGWNSDAPGADLAEPNDLIDVFDLFVLLDAWGACPGSLGACCINDECAQTTEQSCLTAGGVFKGVSVPCAVDTCVNNDSCFDAVDITGNINGATVFGSNSTATPPFGGGDTELPAGSPSCQWAGNPPAAHSTVWYSFIAPPGGEVTVGVCGSQAPFNDSILALYSGQCGSLMEVACDDDGCTAAAPWYSRIDAAGLTPGQTYYVCVMNPGDWAGSVPGPFELTITSP